jgi:hypothetical protein
MRWNSIDSDGLLTIERVVRWVVCIVKFYWWKLYKISDFGEL